jgi:PadR family transcriptional regulator, regulatory protein PadR
VRRARSFRPPNGTVLDCEPMYRKPGTLLPLERRILEIALRNPESGVYGFALAQELAGEKGQTRLVSHGTMYKVLDRLRRGGLLTAEWEDAAAAEAEGRPRRRVYRVTADTAAALQRIEPRARRVRLGEARP